MNFTKFKEQLFHRATRDNFLWSISTFFLVVSKYDILASDPDFVESFNYLT